MTAEYTKIIGIDPKSTLEQHLYLYVGRLVISVIGSNKCEAHEDWMIPSDH